MGVGYDFFDELKALASILLLFAQTLGNNFFPLGKNFKFSKKEEKIEKKLLKIRKNNKTK